MTIKSRRELDLMRKAGAIVAGALALAESSIQPGMTTQELNQLMEEYITAHNAQPSFKNYNGFPAAVCISLNEEVVHGIPHPTRVMQQGDIVSLDIGAYIDGFHGDAARTFPVGQTDDAWLRLIKVAEECFWKGIQHARVGGRIGDIAQAIQQTAENAGYGVVRELIGHGIGHDLHEPPDVPNYGRAGHGPRLQSGMTIAVEPMINAGTKKVLMLDDGWTVVTADSMYSAHFENTIAITDGEPEILTML